MFCALSWPTCAVFVFELYSDNAPAIFPEESFCLFTDLPVETGDILQVRGIIFAGGSFQQKPVGQSSITHFAVGPRADANPHIHAMLRAQLDKPP